ncbi:hypothetical protein [Nostoc sp.]|uniref:hypothetical protein n=1 Tax=Nostoc sp. TaxID=1180 RepID=UPI002FFA6A5F
MIVGEPSLKLSDVFTNSLLGKLALLNQGMILVGWASCPPRNTRDGQDAHPTKLGKLSRKYATLEN